MGSKKQSVDVNVPEIDRKYIDDLIGRAKASQQEGIDYFGGREGDWLQRGLSEQDRLATLTGRRPAEAMADYRKEFSDTLSGVTSKYEPILSNDISLLFGGTGQATRAYGDLSRALDIQQGGLTGRLKEQGDLGFSRLGQGFDYAIEPLSQLAKNPAFNPARDPYMMGLATNPSVSRGDYSSPEFRELSDISADRRRITNLNV